MKAPKVKQTNQGSVLFAAKEIQSKDFEMDKQGYLTIQNKVLSKAIQENVHSVLESQAAGGGVTITVIIETF